MPEIVAPMEIEKRSFEIIAEELGVSQETVKKLPTDSVIVHMVGHNPIKAEKIEIWKAFMSGMSLPSPPQKSDILALVK